MGRFKIRVIPEVSVGNFLQLGTVLITAIIFFVKMDARISRSEEQIQEDRKLIRQMGEVVTSTAQSSAVISALLDEHLRRFYQNTPRAGAGSAKDKP